MSIKMKVERAYWFVGGCFLGGALMDAYKSAQTISNLTEDMAHFAPSAFLAIVGLSAILSALTISFKR